MENTQELESYLKRIHQIFDDNSLLDNSLQKLENLSDRDCLYLDQSLSKLFDANPFHEVLREWIFLCDSKHLKEYIPLQQLCLKLCNGYNQIASLAYSSNDYEVSLECYQLALMLCSSNYSFLRSQLFFNRGIVFIQLQDLANALCEFDMALANNIEFKPAYYQKERVLYKINNQSKNYYFSHDWFSRNIPLLLEHLENTIGLPNCQFLEIGSWEGRSTCWFLEKILTHQSSQITCIDTFAGEGYLNLERNILETVESRFDWNIAQSGGNAKVKKYVGKSQDILRNLPLNTYDLIYIDGCHLAIDVLSDAVLSWGLLKTGGIVVFDDYDKVFPETPSQNTNVAIDAFISCFEPQIQIIHQSHQVYLRKKA
jgi:predicted O-methyltransferase YrrM